MTRVEIKICGVTRIEDATLAVDLGASFLGLNFWRHSPRCLSLNRARAIVGSVRGKARLVGVWVDPTRAEVAALERELELDLLQFHGAPEIERASWFPGRVIQAIGPSQLGVPDLGARYREAWGLLIDAAPDGVWGGTGRAWSYERIADLETDMPILLAGGLTPDNVGDAIRRSKVGIVDVCSGIEAAPGVKDADTMRRFFEEVRNAQESR